MIPLDFCAKILYTMNKKFFRKKIFDPKNVKKLFLSIFDEKCTKSTEPAELTYAKKANDHLNFLY